MRATGTRITTQRSRLNESAYCGIYSVSSHTELWDVLAFFLKRDREDHVLRDSVWQSQAYAVNGQFSIVLE